MKSGLERKTEIPDFGIVTEMFLHFSWTSHTPKQCIPGNVVDIFSCISWNQETWFTMQAGEIFF